MLTGDIWTAISSDQAVQDATGGVDCVYLGAIPKGSPDSPAVVLNFRLVYSSTVAEGQLALKCTRVQVDSYHSKYTDAVAIANAASDVLKKLKGALDTNLVQGTKLTDDMDMPEEAGDTGYVFRRMIAYEVWHSKI